MKNARPDRRSSGFTLLETILSIAVLIILAALAFPFVSTLHGNLRMNELNASARYIFIAAQNQLASQRASGSLDAYSSAPALTGMPADYTETDWTSLSYLSSSEHPALMAALLPAGSIDPALANGCYVVEFNRATGNVYAVFFSDEDFSYDTAALPRDLASRKAFSPPLGYFGGAVLEDGGTASMLPPPQITITNGETLTLSMTTSGYSYADMSYLVTIRSESDPTKFHTFSTASIPTPFTRTLDTYFFLLDSLSDGTHFSDLCPDIVPGDNLIVTVTVSYTGSGGTFLPASATKTTNSLFAGRSGSAAMISCARHLQNLEPSVSGVSTVISAVQTAPVDWSYYTDTFLPVSNSELVAYNGNGLSIASLSAGANGGYSGLFGSFAGGTLSNIRLTDAVVSGGTYSGGLAAYCAGPTTVTKCSLYVTDTANASNYTISGTQYIGGLIGYAPSLSITGSFAAPGGISDSGAAVCMGGLLGRCGAGGTVSECYADTDITSGASPELGGLIGRNEGSSVSNCYALGNLSSVGSTLFGGFVGGGAGSYTNCYAAPTFDGTGGFSTPYGFVGSLSNSFSNCTCLQSSGFALSDPNSSFAPVSYSVLQAWSGGAAWTAALASNSHPYDPVLSGTAYSFKRLVALEHYNDWPDKPAIPSVTSFAYYETYSDGTTGYYATDPSGRVAVNSLSEAKGPATYDGYCLLSIGDLADRTYVFETADGEVSDWLADKGNITITMDGESMTYHVYEIPRYTLLNSNYDISNFYIYIKNMGNTYWYNPHFAKAAVNGSATRPAFNGVAIVRTTRHLAAISSNIYTTYLGSVYTFRQELDLDFAVYDGQDAYDVVSIGTSERPFRGVYNGNGYGITINSDSSHHTAGLFGYTAGTIQNIDLYTTDGYTAGNDSYASGILCGTNTGIVDNCIITFGSSHAIRGGPYGTVAGSNTGTISNCLVTGSQALTLSNNYSNVGGFAGSNSGTITNCFVRPDVTSYAGFTLQGAQSGMFAHSNSGTISGCSATGVTTGGSYDPGMAAGFVCANTGSITACYSNSIVSGFYAAGFAYSNSGAEASIRNCYSMLSVTSLAGYGGGAAGFVYEGSSGVSDCYAATEVTGYTSYTFGTGTLGPNCRYYTWSGSGSDPSGIASSLGTLLSAFSGSPWGAADTHVYRDRYTSLSDSCPFPLLAGLDHYGDWHEPYTRMFAYYESYNDGTYGYHALNADGTERFNTLSNVKGPLIGDGYLLLTKSALSDLTVTYQTSSSSTTTTTAIDLGTVSLTLDGISGDYHRYCLPSAVLNSSYAASDFYQTLGIGGVTYWYNPHFANAAINAAATIPSFGGTAVIRSTRQLANLGSTKHTVYWASAYTIQQQLDLNFDLNSVAISAPIGTSSTTPFYGIYDGGNHTITINSAAKNGKNALFGYNSGSVRNLTLATSGTFSMGVTDAVGGVLTATNAGTIQNCTVSFGAHFSFIGTSFGVVAGSNTGTISGSLVTSSAAITVSGSGSTTVGGFAGTSSGTITGCYVRPSGTSYAALTVKGYTSAGFVHTNSGSITGCSATGSVGVLSPTTTGCNAAGFVYTNTGSVSGCYANCLVTADYAAGFAYASTGSSRITNCYAMLKVIADPADGGAAGFVYTANNKVTSSYAAAQVSGGSASYTFSSNKPGSNCYYLNWTGRGNNATSGTTSASLSTLLAYFNFSPWGAAATHVYQDQYTGLPSACPFPLLAGLAHYGDWPPV